MIERDTTGGSEAFFERAQRRSSTACQELCGPQQSSVKAMFDVLDLLLLRRGIPADDRTLTFRRIDGNPDAKVIYFLPWHTPYTFARQAGLVRLNFLASYEMPPAIVSSEPQLCVEAMLGLVADAKRLLRDQGVDSRDALIVGLSVGSYPATYLANCIGARLCSVAAADRADLMLWQSPAARLVKRRAMQRGIQLSHYTKAMLGYHPVDNLAGIGTGSTFVIGERDPFIPPSRSAGLLSAVESQACGARVVKLNAGHLKTLVASGRHQRAMMGDEVSRVRWPLQIPAGLSLPQLAAARPDTVAEAGEG
jgi:hypothetical protein